MEIVGEKCPRCGEDKIPNDSGVKQFQGNRSFADHWWYRCENNGFTNQ